MKKLTKILLSEFFEAETIWCGMLGSVTIGIFGIFVYNLVTRFLKTLKILLFLSLGILLHRNPLEYSKAISDSVRGTAGIVLQFPFYGGIMGLMRDSGLGAMIAHGFVGLGVRA